MRARLGLKVLAVMLAVALGFGIVRVRKLEREGELAAAAVRDEAMARRQAHIKSLVDVAWCALDDFYYRAQLGNARERKAASSATAIQQEALHLVRNLRYEGGEYFWVNDLAGKMLMHPYIGELEGKSVLDYRDTRGIYLFREFIRVAKTEGSGFVAYEWPKPGKALPEQQPKISYVRLFEPWGWIVGSGAYIDDIEHETAAARAQIRDRVAGELRQTAGLMVIACLAIMVFAVVSEKRRAVASAVADSEKRLRLIVEGAPDGIVLSDADSGAIVLANHVFSDLVGVPLEQVTGTSLDRYGAPDAARERDGPSGSWDLAPGELRLRNTSGVAAVVERREAHLTFLGKDCILTFLRDVTARKQAEQKFAKLFRGTPAMLAITEPETGLIWEVNDGFCAGTGWSREEALGRRTVEVGLFTSLAGRNAFLEGIQNTGSLRNTELEFRTKTGEPRVGLASFELVDLAGEPCLLSAIIDITERKSAEEALRESEERFRALMEMAPVGVYLVDAHGRTTYGNERLREISGVSVSEGDATGWTTCVHPEDRERVFSKWREAAAAGSTFKAEYRFVRPDATITHTIGQAVPLRDASGGVAGYIGTVTDITEQKQADKELQTYREHLEELVRVRTDELEKAKRQTELILSSVGEGIYGVDLEGRVTLANPVAARMLGWDEPELLGREAHPLMHHTRTDGTPYPSEACPSHLSFRDGKTCRVADEVFWRKDGTSFPVEYVSTPVQEGENLVGAVVVFDDISERKHLEGELRSAKDAAEAASQAKSAFLASMSHEIRTPMNAILGFSQLLLRDPALSPRQRQHLDTVNRSGEHLLGLINDILEISKIEAGRVTSHPVAFDLPALASEMETMFRLRTNTMGLGLNVQLSDDLPRHVVADERKLRQVFINLLSNAVKFTEKGGVTLCIRVDREESGGLWLQVDVGDTGPGISEEDQGRLFQRFEQTTSGRQKMGGTGLGLAISREYVWVMGGDIGVTSRAGQGSVFWFRVPVQEGMAVATKKRGDRRRVLGLRPGQPVPRVLVADDQESNRDLLRHMLGEVGFEIRLVANGDEAVREFEAWDPQLILMDRRMPVLDGDEATRRIRASPGGNDVRIVSVTASAFEEDRQEVLAAGVDDFVSKPFREGELFAKIGALLGLAYMYEDQATKGSAPVAGGLIFEGDALAALPVGLAEKMRQATLAADLDELLERIDEAAQTAPQIAAHLRTLAESFQYRELLRWLG